MPQRPLTRVALTFDDGPNPGCTDALLDLLAELGARATFCVVASSISRPGGAALLSRIVAEGHALANHSSDFEDLGELPPDDIRRRIVACDDAIRAVVPEARVSWFRAPNGSWGVDARVARVARELGLAPLPLGNVIHDWRDDWQDPDRLARNLRGALQPDAIVLAHDGGGRRFGTVAACERVLPELVGTWEFVTPEGLPPEATALHIQDETPPLSPQRR